MSRSFFNQCLMVLVLVLGMSSLAPTSTVQAQPFKWITQASPTSPARFIKWTFGDAFAMVKGIPSKNTLYALGTTSGLAVVSLIDEPVTHRIAAIDESQPTWHYVERMGSKDVVPKVAFAVFAGSMVTGSTRFQDAAFTSLQSVFFASTVTGVLKYAFGRARPRQDDNSNNFQPFTKGFTSFPSGHSTAAFALLTPWMLYYPSLQTASLMVLASGTAFSRMAYNAHWLTDVLAGSTIGFMTSYLLTRRHQRANARFKLDVGVTPERIAMSIRF